MQRWKDQGAVFYFSDKNNGDLPAVDRAKKRQVQPSAETSVVEAPAPDTSVTIGTPTNSLFLY